MYKLGKKAFFFSAFKVDKNLTEVRNTMLN